VSDGLHGFSGFRPGTLRVGLDARGLCGERTGVGTYAANLIRAMPDVEPDISVVLVSAEALPAEGWTENERVRKVIRRGGGRNNLLWSHVSLRRAIAGERVDVFHGPGYTRPFGLGVPSVVTLHDISYAAAPQWYPYRSDFLRQAWYRQSAVGADAILTVSEFSRREIIRVYGVPADEVHTVYQGVDHRRFFPLAEREPIRELLHGYGLPKDFVLFVGDVHARRNLGRVIEAAQRVNMPLVVIGRVVEKPATAAQADVRYLGYVPEADLPLFYNAARALVYVSLYEGFGFPIVEAMACGCPAIVSRGTACEETAGEAGVKVDPESVQAIADAIAGVLKNPDVAGRAVEAGIKRAAEFDWRKTAEETLKVYRQISAGLTTPALRATPPFQGGEKSK
jgi:glycosyltransferase involved in cell wall biosynthesis